MGIPKNFGISKISVLRGDEVNRYGGREGSSSSRRAGSSSSGQQQQPLSFQLDNAQDAVALLQPPSFNVLYVATPKIGLLQTPEFRAIAQLWEETVELVKPLMRFGFPETSLKTKCPYYDEELYTSRSGYLLANHRTRTIISGAHKGYFGPTAATSSQGHNSSSSSMAAAAHGSNERQQQHQEQQQEGPSQSVGMFGISTLAWLARNIMGRGRKQQQDQQQQQQQGVTQAQADLDKQQVQFHPAELVYQPARAQQRQQQQQQPYHGREEAGGGGGGGGGAAATQQQQQQQQHIPHGKFLVPDIPSGTLVLCLNLMTYWAITNQSRRSSMGGTMMS